MGKHFEHGRVLLGLRRYTEAAGAFTEDLAEEPDSLLTHAMLASALANSGRYERAEEVTHRMLELEPDYAYGFYMLSYIEGKRNHAQTAEKAIHEALRLSPEADYFCHLGRIYFATWRYQECLDITETALALEPDHSNLLVLRGRTLAALGRLHEAQQVLFIALANEPGDSAAHHALGMVGLRVGETKDALTFLREARRLDPLTKNDSDAIALAYGRLLWPFRWFDRYMLRWYLWPHKKRWLYFVCLGVFVATASAILKRMVGNYSYVMPMVAAIAANVIVIPYTFDQAACASAKIVARRVTGVRWSQVLFQLVVIAWILAIHFGATLLGLLYGNNPGWGVVFLCIAICFDLSMRARQACDQVEGSLPLSIPLGYLPVGLLLWVSGGIVSAKLQKSPSQSIPYLILFLAVSFFSDNIANLIDRFGHRSRLLGRSKR